MFKVFQAIFAINGDGDKIKTYIFVFKRQTRRLRNRKTDGRTDRWTDGHTYGLENIQRRIKNLTCNHVIEKRLLVWLTIRDDPF